MTQERPETGETTMDEIWDLFQLMDLASEANRERLLGSVHAAFEEGRTTMEWIEAATGTTTWMLHREATDA